MQTLRKILWALVALGVIVFAVLAFTAQREGLPEPASRPDPDATVTIGGPFTLVGSDGEPFSSEQLAGRPQAIFFGFTSCPDICPATLADLVRYRKQLGDEDAFSIVFISVDPERDGPEEVGRYADLFATDVIGLTGSQAQLDKVMEQFGVAAIREDSEDGNYDVNHTANVFLIDRDGNFQSTISPEESDEAALAKLERLTR